jgi:glycosyltransferase involved in cell wall biosynthesis
MTSEKIQSTVAILTFNSGKVLATALESVQDFDEILICDGGSTDDTVYIGRALGARVILQDQKNKDANNRLVNYGGARQQCLEAAKHDWFLYIDSDETISDGLRLEIREITSVPLSVDSPLVYQVPITILVDEKPIRYSTNYPGYQTRFFNRTSGAHFIKQAHERIDFDRSKVKIGKVTNPWYTHTKRAEWEHYLSDTAMHRRTEILARCKQPFSDYIHLALGRNLRNSLVVFIKASGMYLIHGSSGTLPIRGELGRAIAPLIVAWGITACRFNLPGGIVNRP